MCATLAVYVYKILKAYDSYLKKITLWMKTIHYSNKIRSHLVTIVLKVPFTPKSTSKLRSALHFGFIIETKSSHALFPARILLNPNNHYNHCNCWSKLVSQLTNGQLNFKCDDTKAYVDLYRFIMKTGQSASHNRLWQ